jgi:hypothetical protein
MKRGDRGVGGAKEVALVGRRRTGSGRFSALLLTLQVALEDVGDSSIDPGRLFAQSDNFDV